MNYWQRWTSQPQTTWLRKALFQVHMWSGIGFGLYILLVSVTGSVLVYRNELYRATMPESLAYGEPAPLGYRMVSTLMELHDDLLAGQRGRSVNGIAALLVMIVALSGIVVWWPGIKTWRRSLTIPRNAGRSRFNWHLHSMLGFWSFGFIVVFAMSGAYLGNPDWFQYVADRIDPPTDIDSGERLIDQVLYWLAYLHFGRINGIGIPCGGPGFCDQATKFVWAAFGLAPAGMFVTGALMWWKRVGTR